METLFIILLIAIIILYSCINQSNITYEYFDEKKYLVRNLPDKKNAVDTLHKIYTALHKLTNDIYNDDSIDNNMKQYVQRIYDKIDTVKIQESDIHSKYTSYCVNKGDILVFCIRSKITNKIHDINDLLYVAIHELAHIGCPEEQHTELFWKINKFLLKEAVKRGIYIYEDYSKNKREYCGIELSVSVI